MRTACVRLAWLVLPLLTLACRDKGAPQQALGQGHGVVLLDQVLDTAGNPVAALLDGRLATGVDGAVEVVTLRSSAALVQPIVLVHAQGEGRLQLMPARGGMRQEWALQPGWNLRPVGVDGPLEARLEFERGQTLRINEVMVLSASAGGSWQPLRTLVDGAPSVSSAVAAVSPGQASLSATAARCQDFDFELSTPPTGLQRVVMAAQATNAWGFFALERSINSGVAQQPAALAVEAPGARRPVEMLLPVEQLRLGANRVTLCVDRFTPRDVRLEDVRVVLEARQGMVAPPGPVATWAPVLDGDAKSSQAMPVTLPLAGPAQVVGLQLEHPGELGALAVVLDGRGTPFSLLGGPRGLTSLALDAAQAEHNIQLQGGGAVTELRVLALPLSDARNMEVQLDFPVHAEWIGPFAVVTGTVLVHGRAAAGAVSLIGDGITQQSGAVENGWFSLAAMRLDQRARVEAQLVVQLDSGEEAVVPLAFEEDVVQRPQPGRGTTTLTREEERELYGLVGDPPAKTVVTPVAGGELVLGKRVKVLVPPNAVAQNTTVTLQRVSEMGLHPLNPGMVNVTAPGGAVYRFLPSPIHFNNKLTVTLPYDRTLLPGNMQPADIQTFYFDEATGRYQPLETLNVDTSQQVVLALTDHFTDMINAVLVQPESPTPQSFNPNAISGLAAAEPTAEMTLVAPPQPRPDGTASITYPFKLPRGRGRYQPSLALQYTSQGGHGVAGWGWNLTLSSVDVDTRYGVPEYATRRPDLVGQRPGERYLLDGQQLVPTEDLVTCRSGGSGRQFRQRREGRFALIVRCGTDPGNYVWEVTDKDGTHMTYGTPGARLEGEIATGPGLPKRMVIGRWLLATVEDANGNVSRYIYDTVPEHGQFNSSNFSRAELKSIQYASAAGVGPTYQVDLTYRQIGTTDAPDAGVDLDAGGLIPEQPDAGWPVGLDVSMEASLGFPVIHRDRVVAVAVGFAPASGAAVPFAEWRLHYEQPGPDNLYRTLLAQVDSYGEGQPSDVHSTRFEYSKLEPGSEAFTGAANGMEEWTLDPEDHLPLQASLSDNRNGELAGTVSLGFQVAPNIKGPSAGVSLSGSFGGGQPIVTMVDVNGDGLPDRVVQIPVPRTEEVPGAGFVASQLPVSRAVVYINTGRGFAQAGTQAARGQDPGLVSLESPAIESDRTAGFGLGVNGSVGTDFINLGGSLTAQGGFNITPSTLMDVNGDGLVDQVAATTSYQQRLPTGHQTFTGAGAVFGTECLDPAPADGDEPQLYDFVSTALEKVSGRDAVWRWRAPHDGRVTVSVTATQLASCAGQTQPPQLTLAAVPNPRTSTAARPPVPDFLAPPISRIKGSEFADAQGNHWRWTYESEFFREDALRRYRALGKDLPEPPQVTRPAGEGGTSIVQTYDIQRGGEVLVRVTPGNGCADQELSGLSNTVALNMEVQYEGCDAPENHCEKPWSRRTWPDAEASKPGSYVSDRDFRITGPVVPLVIQRSSTNAVLSGQIYTLAPEDEVTLNVLHARCRQRVGGLIGDLVNASPTSLFPFSGFQGTAVSPGMFNLPPDFQADLTAQFIAALPECTVTNVPVSLDGHALGPRGVVDGNSPLGMAVSAVLLDTAPGDLLYVYVQGRTPIDPRTVQLDLFKLTFEDLANPAETLTSLINPAGGVAVDAAGGAVVPVPVHVGWRPLVPHRGYYRRVSRTDEALELGFVLPATWLMGGPDDRPTLLVQNAKDGTFSRIPMSPDGTPGVCSSTLVCALPCVPSSCVTRCAGTDPPPPACFGPASPTAVPPNPRWTTTLSSAQLGRGDVFLSIEPPPSLLKARVAPSPTDLPGTLSFLKDWLDPAALARNSVQWAEWMLFLSTVEHPPAGFLAVTKVNGTQRTALDDAINVLEPDGTYGLPLPVPLPSLNRLFTAEGFNGWGYGEAVSDPRDARPLVLEGPDLEGWSPNVTDWNVPLGDVGPGMANGFEFLANPANGPGLLPQPVAGRLGVARGAVVDALDLTRASTGTGAPGAGPKMEGVLAAFGTAMDGVTAAPFDALHLPRLIPMFPNAPSDRFQGSCASSRIEAGYATPGRCLPGDVTGLPGTPISVPVPRENLERIKRLLTCPRGVPRLTVNGGISASASVAVFGVRLGVSLNESILDYRDVTGDGIPDILLQTSAGIMVLKAELPQRGVVPPGPRLTSASLPYQGTLGITTSLNASASTPTVQPTCNNGQGRGCGNRANVALTAAREGLAFAASGAGELTVQADLTQLADINGDGLPDLVRSGVGFGCAGVVARLNLGGRFDGDTCIAFIPDETGGTYPADGLLGLGVSVGLSGNINAGLSSQKGSHAGVHGAATISRHNQHATLADINGDGLPDLVRNLGSGTMVVNFNLGRRFSPTVYLNISTAGQFLDLAGLVDEALPARVQLNVSDSLKTLGDEIRSRVPALGYIPPGLGQRLAEAPLPSALSATNSFTLSMGGGGSLSGGAPIGFGVNIGVGAGETVSWSNVQFMDLDGDGLPEPVRRAPEGKIQARLNQLGKVNRLIRVVNPLGGSIEMEYARTGNSFEMPQNRWVLSSVTVNHDVNSMEPGPGSADSTRRHTWAHSYAGGVWDRLNKDFLGFGRVVTRQDRTSLQGPDRYTCTRYDVSDYQHAGKVLEQVLSTQPDCSGGVLELTQHTYHAPVVVSVMDDPVLCPVLQPLSMLEDKPRAPGEPDWRVHPANPCNAAVVHPDATLRVSYEENGVAAHKLERAVAYDRYGNVTLVEDQDDVDDSTDDVQVAVRYRAVGPAYLAALPEHFEVRHQGALLRSRGATYDDRGNLLEHRSWHEDGVLLTKYQFDEVGNLRQITAPTGQVIQVEYDATRTFPTEVRDDNLGLVSSQEWDVRWGKPTRTTDTNGGVMTVEYDHRGRFLSAISPLTGELVVGAGYGCLGMSGTNAARCATTLNLVEADARTARSGVMTFTAVDGMGAKRFTAKTELAPPFNTTLFGAHHVDAWGRTVRTSKPIPKSLGDVFLLIPSLGFSVPALGLPTDMPALEEATHTVLDVRDRPTQVIEPGNRVTEFIYSAWEHEGLPRQRVTTLDPDGSQTGRILDGDQLLGTVEYFDEEKSLTSYHYTVLDELFSVWHGGVPFAAMTYDALGRRTREITLDTGTRTFEYHPVTGLLTRETNGSGEAVECFYEPRSSRMTSLTRGERRVWLRYGQGDADKVNHTVGRVKEALYDVIPPAFGTFQQSRAACINDTLCAAESYRFDALGQQVERSRALPGGETLSTVSVLDSFGRVRSLTHSRGGDAVEVAYSYNSSGRVDRAEGKAHGVPRRWVDSVQYDHQGRTVGIQFGNGVRKEYTYNPQTDWMTRVVACDPGFGGTSCAGSNKVYQDLALTHSPAGDIRTAATSSTRNDLLAVQAWGFEYDRRHRLTGATLTAHGWEAGHPTVDPTLTWRETWKFDRLHRLEERTTNKWSDTGAAEQRTERFAFSGLHQPRCAPLATSGADPCEETREAYDGAGRVLVLTSPTSDKRALEWTHDSMLRRVTDADGATLQENGYALAGERTTRSGTYGTYRYLGPTVTDGPSGLNAHVWVNGSRVATAFPAGTYFYISDQLGSTTMVLDKDGDVVTQVVQSPYGREIFQSAAPDWAPPAQQFLLTGKERDPETGFHAYGWRDWSSAGNHWLAPEPIWEDALKQGAVALNLYQGMNWRGTVAIDRDGRRVTHTDEGPVSAETTAPPPPPKFYKSADAAAFAGLRESRSNYAQRPKNEWGVSVFKVKGQELYFHGPAYEGSADRVGVTQLRATPPRGAQFKGGAHIHVDNFAENNKPSLEDRSGAKLLPVRLKDWNVEAAPGPLQFWVAGPNGGVLRFGEEDPIPFLLPVALPPLEGAPRPTGYDGKPVPLEIPDDYLPVPSVKAPPQR